MMKMTLDGHYPSRSRLAAAIDAQRPFAFVALGLAVLYIVGTAMWSSALPASYWMQVPAVIVADAKAGQPPLIQEQIIIHRTVLTTRIATVLKEQPDGRMARVCTSRQWVTYDVGYGPPEHMDLDWWMMPDKCPLGAGEYILQTSWYLKPSGHYRKELHVRSNKFRVTN